MVTSEHFRRQAAVCLRLAAAIKDKKIAGALVEMADDFSDQADEIDPSLGSNGSSPAETSTMHQKRDGHLGRQPKG